MVDGGSVSSGVVISSEEVRRELIELRSRAGMSMRKIRDISTAIVRLPMVDDELRRRPLAESDRHVAAYEVIRCAVRRLVPRTDLSYILRETLNINGEDSEGLERRRTAVRTALFLQEKPYSRLEEEAYINLAGAMVVAAQSPCREGGGEAKLQVNFSVEASPEAVSYLLNLLSIEDRLAVRAELSRAVLDALPNARTFLLEARDMTKESPQGALATLGDAVLRNWTPTGKESVSAFMAESLSQLLFTDRADPARKRAVAVEEERRQPWKAEGSLLFIDVLTSEFYERLQTSIHNFANFMLEIDKQNTWHQIVDGSASAGVIASPVPAPH